MSQKTTFDWMRQQRNGRHMSTETRDVTGDQTPPSGAMEGGGAYNKNAKLQASGGAFALPHLENAARSIVFNPDSQPIVIADYGSSQGKNSLLPMRVAIEVVQARLGSDRPIFVYHEDLPANDFNSLFEVQTWSRMPHGPPMSRTETKKPWRTSTPCSSARLSHPRWRERSRPIATPNGRAHLAIG